MKGLTFVYDSLITSKLIKSYESCRKYLIKLKKMSVTASASTTTAAEEEFDDCGPQPITKLEVNNK